MARFTVDTHLFRELGELLVGRDSTALLHATLKAAAGQGIEVLALHVNHGLSRHADAWQLHAQAQCERWAARGLPVQFHAVRLDARPAQGDSVEAWATASPRPPFFAGSQAVSSGEPRCCSLGP